MRKIPIVLAFILILQNNFAQQPDKEGVRRIGDYGKLWVVLNLFHPAMAYDRINADSLFTDHIVVLLKDPSAANFKNAVQEMIGKLQDPSTTIEGARQSTDTFALPNRPLLRWLRDSVALLHFDNGFMWQNSSNFSPNEALVHIVDSVKNAHGIIIDLREPAAINDDDAKYFKSGFMRQLISMLADHPVAYPSYRTRIHYGHESQTFNSAFYYQGWFLKNSSVLSPKTNSIRKPVCLIINKYNNIINEDVVAMQKGNIAKVIADGALDDFESRINYPMHLADCVTVNIRLSELSYTDNSNKFVPDALIIRKDTKNDDTLVSTANALRNRTMQVATTVTTPANNQSSSTKVAAYDDLSYPSPPLRLLGLMRYWSAINYFCPNKDRITKNWDSVLYEYVPVFLAASDSFQYALAAARLIKEINDSHGFFYSPVYSKLMTDAPALELKYLENKTIVYGIFNDSLKSNFSVGDEIVAVDGRPIRKCRDSIGQYVGASNDASLQRDITTRVLAGPSNTSVNITYLHNGISKTIVLPRKVPWYQYYFAPVKTGPVWKKLANNIGYVDFGRLTVAQIDSMFTDLSNTSTLIIDDRSYPQGTVWTIVNYLADKTVYGAKGATVIADSPDPVSVTVQETLWEIPVTPKSKYKGKIIILVNELTQSQAEYSCMVIQAAFKNVTIIGSQTTGADGDITGIVLPGGIRTAFSGHGVHYPDGRPTQGIGIVPQIKVKPTIKGIKAGKDEVLDRAILFATIGK